MDLGHKDQNDAVVEEEEAPVPVRRPRGRPGRKPKPPIVMPENFDPLNPPQGLDVNGKKLRKGFVLVEQDENVEDVVELDETAELQELYGGRKKRRTEYVPGTYFPDAVNMPEPEKKDVKITKAMLVASAQKVRNWHRKEVLIGELKLFKWVPESEATLVDLRPTKKQKYKRRSRSAYGIVEARLQREAGVKAVKDTGREREVCAKERVKVECGDGGDGDGGGEGKGVPTGEVAAKVNMDVTQDVAAE